MLIRWKRWMATEIHLDHRMWKNNVKEIVTTYGMIAFSFAQIKKVAFQHFNLLYSESLSTRLEDISWLLVHIPTIINPQENEDLSTPMEEDKVFKAIQQMDSNKASGLDGFFAHFLKIYGTQSNFIWS